MKTFPAAIAVLRRIVVALLCSLLLISSATGRITTGDAAPDFALKSLTGSNLRLSEYRGQVVLLSFWASWCGSCREQLSQLSGLTARYGDAGLQVLTVSVDSKPEKTRDAAGNVSFPVLLDDAKRVARTYDPGKLPLTVLIDPHGTLRYIHKGFRPADIAAYAQEIEILLGE